MGSTPLCRAFLFLNVSFRFYHLARCAEEVASRFAGLERGLCSCACSGCVDGWGTAFITLLGFG